jgi:hypothetical protein
MLKIALHIQKGWLSLKQAPGKNMAPRKPNFSHLHHQTHSWPEKKLQEACNNKRKAGRVSLRLLNFFRLKQTPVCFMMFNILFGPYTNHKHQWAL